MPAAKKQTFTTKQKAIGATSAAVIAASTTLISQWEGLFTKPYLDIVGVKTVCYGATAAEKIDLNRSYTPTECKEILARSIPKYDNAIKSCMTRDIPDSVHVALISLAYNVGSAGVCRSTAMRLANAGDFKGACNALLAWNKAGGRVVKGLENRRRAEREICLKGL